MDDQQDTFQDIIHRANFMLIAKQNEDNARVETEGHANKVTYIQAGELWFGTLCIISCALLTVFIYAVVYISRVCNKRDAYEHVLFQKDTVRIIGMISDDDDDEEEDDDDNDEDETTRNTTPTVILRNILPTWSCVAYIVCLLSISLHCMLRILYSYNQKLQDRMLLTAIQIYLSSMTCVTSTILLLIYVRCTKDNHADSKWLSSTGQVVLFHLQQEAVWGLHVVSTVVLFDDILVLVAVKTFDADSQDGTSLTNLLYIWLGLFTSYIIVLYLMDWWINENILILPSLLVLIILCEIPLRNYKSMSEDPASLGTSCIGLLIILCLSGRMVYVSIHKGKESIPHFKTE